MSPPPGVGVMEGGCSLRQKLVSAMRNPVHKLANITLKMVLFIVRMVLFIVNTSHIQVDRMRATDHTPLLHCDPW